MSDDNDLVFGELKDQTDSQESFTRPSLDGSEVYVIRNRRRLGPFRVEYLADMVDAGMVEKTDLAALDGCATFMPVDQIIRQLKPPDPADTDVDPSLQIRELYITHSGKKTGPYTLTKAELLLNSGLVDQTDPVTYKDCIQPVPLGPLLASVKRATTTFNVSELRNYSEQIKKTTKSEKNSVKSPINPAGLLVKHRLPLAIIVLLGVLSVVFLNRSFIYNSWFSSNHVTVVMPSRDRQEIIRDLLYAFADFKKLTVSSDSQSSSIILGSRVRFKLITSSDKVTSEGEQANVNIMFCSYRGLSSRKKGESEHLLGYEGLTVVANRTVKLTYITKTELISSMGNQDSPGHSNNVQGTGLTRIFIPSVNNKSWSTFTIHFPHLVQFSSRVQPLDSDSNILAAVDSFPNSIGIVSFNSTGNFNSIAVSQNNTLPSAASVFNLRTEDYLLSNRISFVTQSGRVQPQLQEFMNFIDGPSAHQVLVKHGIIPPAVKTEYPTMIWQVPMTYRATVQNYARLSTSIRFDKSEQFDNPTEKNLELTADFIKKYAPSKRILLAGFSPETGHDAQNDSLSRIFTEKVSTWFQNEKITNLDIHTFGSSIQVVDNDSPESFLNARVELWIEP